MNKILVAAGAIALAIGALALVISEVVRPPPPAQTSQAGVSNGGKKLYRVLYNTDDQKMRSGPALKYPIVVWIPPGASGIALGDCRAAEDQSRSWCAATWQNHSGWISSCCIVDEKTGERPRVD